MSLWLYLVIVATVNLVLGAATAIYLRKQIELLDEMYDRRKTFGPEGVEAQGCLAEQRSQLGGGQPDNEPSEVPSPRDTGEKPTESLPGGNVLGQGPFPDGVPAADAGSFDSSGSPDEIGVESAQGLQVDVPGPPEPIRESPDEVDFSEKTSPEVPAQSDGGNSPEDSSRAVGESPNQGGTAPDADVSQGSPPLDRENAADAEDETFDKEQVPPEVQREDIEDFGDWQSPILNLIRLAHKTISRLRAMHDNLFRTPPADRERLATVLASVEPEIDELIHSYHQSLPRIVGEGSAKIPDELLAQLQQRITALQGLEVRMSSLDLRGDFSATLKEAQAEWGHLLAHVHALRDALEVAFATSVAAQATRPPLEAPVCRDPLTKLLNRTGVEVFLEAQGLRHLARDQFSAVLFDLDQFRKVNERFGHAIGDQVLARVADVLRQQNLRDAVWARYAGDQFLVLLPRAVLRRTVEEAERIRQQMEATVIKMGPEHVSLTLSAAITELRTDDTTLSFFQRLEETLRQAKRAGGNRSFTHDGRMPAPVIPPNLQVASRTVEVTLDEQAAPLQTDDLAETFLRR